MPVPVFAIRLWAIRMCWAPLLTCTPVPPPLMFRLATPTFEPPIVTELTVAAPGCCAATTTMPALLPVMFRLPQLPSGRQSTAPAGAAASADCSAEAFGSTEVQTKLVGAAGGLLGAGAVGADDAPLRAERTLILRSRWAFS